jgi:uncharacterized phage protein (TIGR01671 family)
MREILFRGKRVDNGKWIEGSYIEPNAIFSLDCAASSFDKFNGKCSIGIDVYLVDPETISQFTGMHDKHGKKVFEGDYDKDYQVVKWCESRKGWAMSIYDFPTKEYICCHCYNCEGNYDISEVQDEIEIIGNIYEKEATNE